MAGKVVEEGLAVGDGSVRRRCLDADGEDEEVF